MSELPEVNETRCTACGDCVLVCPTECLAMDGPLPYLVRPVDCIACSLCVLICPDDAMRMVEGEVE
jgi:formate hydrogenlyase subunit 6/NADH:ubiquinone oxidoreductase subunit I